MEFQYGAPKARRTLHALVALLFATALAGVACQTKNRVRLGLPGINTPLEVDEVTARGSRLQTLSIGDGVTIQSFVPDSEVCRRVMTEGAEVYFNSAGVFGAYQANDESCGAVGIFDLEWWRDRRGRPPTSSGMVPRSQSNFRVLHRDDDLILLRGRFMFATYFNFPDGADVVAAIPNEGVCAGVAERGVASLEYRARGNNALALVGSSGLCRLSGLIQP